MATVFFNSTVHPQVRYIILIVTQSLKAVDMIR